MPWKLSPGTPSMFDGSRIPCQWIDVSTPSRFATRNVTVLPWRQRSSGPGTPPLIATALARSEEHTSELQSLMRISYAVFCLKKNKTQYNNKQEVQQTTT